MPKINRPPTKNKEKNIKEATKDIERAAKVLRLVKNENQPEKPLTKREQEKQERVDKELLEEIEWRDKAVTQVFREGRGRGAPTKLTEQVMKTVIMKRIATGLFCIVFKDII